MKKILLLAICFTFSFQSVLASHLLGAEIFWEDAGNNQVVFYLKIYRECGTGAASLPTAPLLASTMPGSPNIPMSLQSTTDISPVCLGAGSISCNTSPSGMGAVQMGLYKSSPVSISQPVPASGYQFEFNHCCRPGSIVNVGNAGSSQYSVKSIMLPGATSPGSSPEFFRSELSLNESGSLSLMASTPAPGDSLYYDFYNPGVSYSAGYTASSPLPNASSTWIDHQTGLLHYDMSSATAGTYVMGVEVECWRNNQLVSITRRDAAYAYLSGSSSNTPPNTLIDTAAYALNRDSLGYTAVVAVGDTLRFQVSTSDFDYLPQIGLPQTITFSATGSALDASWGGGFSFQSKPVLAPVAPQSGFSSQLNNNISFNWATGVEHLQGQRGTYDFVLSFKDNSCPVPAQTNIPVRVIVQAPSYIQADTITICEGDSVAIAGITISQTYQWSPQTNITSTSVAQPLVYPSSSGYYYLEDPQSPGYKDSVYVLVEQRHNFNLSYSNSILQVEDSVGTGSRTWYYNGIPFVYSFDTLTPFGPGQYSVQLVTGSCKYYSDTIMVQPGSFCVVQPGNGGYYGRQIPVPGSIGVTFSLDGSGNLSSVSIPGVKDLQTESGGYDLTLKIYDQNQQEQLKKSIVLQPPFDEVVEIQLNFAVSAGVDYTIALSGDTSYAFSLYEGVSVPFTPWNNGLHVKGYSKGQAGYFPQSASDYLLPLTMQVSNFVGFEEISDKGVFIYPNPARDQITLELAHPGARIMLYNLEGQLVHQALADSDKYILERKDLPTGVYLIKIHTRNSVVSRRIIFH